MSDSLFAGRRFAVVGLGRNGLPAASRLASMGAHVVVWDDGEVGREAARLADLELLGDLSGLDGVDALVLSPGIAHYGSAAHPLTVAAIRRGVPILSDSALLFEAVRRSGSAARFVGITGTNGKSTTTVLLAHLLVNAGIEAAAGGNLGPAALSLPLLGNGAVYVLEMSSYMLERVPDLHFDAACLLNISPDHLDRHGDMAGYLAAKRRIFDNREPRDLAVVGVDDPVSRDLASSIGAVTVSGCGPADWGVDNGMLSHAGHPVADLSACPALRGAHNVQNAAAACAMAVFLGAPAEGLEAALRSFDGLAHRQKLVASGAGVDFIDDSKATNVDAAACALGAIGRCVWIAGGMGKDGGIEDLVGALGDVVEALLIGRDADQFARTLAAAGVPHRIVGTLDEAVRQGFILARKTGTPTVLLSPAAASFDQFTDYEARGRCFAELARAIVATEAA